MFWRKLVMSYGHKNFRDYMQISDNITIKGILRRYQRKYPQFFSFTKKSFIVGSLCVLILALVPGSQMPLQKQIKISIFGFSSMFSRLWFYNSLTPNYGDYLLKINQIILVALNQQIYEIRLLSKYLNEIRSVATQCKKELKNRNYLDILLYSELILQNIVKHSNRTLLEPQLKQYYKWILEMTINNLSEEDIKEKNKNTIILFHSIIQYLLKFVQQEEQNFIIHQYFQHIKMFKSKQKCQQYSKNSFRYLLAVQGIKQKQFIQNLKKIYQQTPSIESKKQIIDIFQCLDNVYIIQNKKNNQQA